MILGSGDLDQETWAALEEEGILLDQTSNDIKIIGNYNRFFGTCKQDKIAIDTASFYGCRKGRRGYIIINFFCFIMFFWVGCLFLDRKKYLFAL